MLTPCLTFHPGLGGAKAVERLGVSKIWSFLSDAKAATVATNTAIRADDGNFVDSYLTLAARIAELQYRNRGHVLLFRGQNRDWKTLKGLTTLKPSIFRYPPGKLSLPDSTLEHRYAALLEAENLLAEKWSALAKLGRQKLVRERLLRWSIIQHYEICPTPLLDVTHSLRIAASFAGSGPGAILYVLAVPNVSGAITADAEAGLQIVRLSSVCPPAAIRPHIQEGYLLSEYPEMAGLIQKKHYSAFEMDFGRRLIAKFRFNPAAFWKDENFPPVSDQALYPKGRDWIENLTAEVAAEIKQVAA